MSMWALQPHVKAIQQPNPANKVDFFFKKKWFFIEIEYVKKVDASFLALQSLTSLSVASSYTKECFRLHLTN